MKNKKIAIVGAGLAGVVCANALKSHRDVRVFDKSRGVGGRMATRRSHPFAFDHGAQFIADVDGDFRAVVRGLAEKGIVDPWQGRFGSLTDTGFVAQSGDTERLVPRPGMSSLVKALAADVSIKTETQIARLSFTRDVKNDQGIELFDSKGQPQGRFDYVVFAIPQPQLIPLISTLIKEDDDLATVRMLGCYSLMIGDRMLDQPANRVFGFDGADVDTREQRGEIRWIACNSEKPGRPTDAPGLVVQSDPIWAQEHIDDDQDQVRHRMLQRLQQLTGYDAAKADYVTLHRWRYAFTQTALGKPFWRAADAPIFACGDWCLGDRANDAFASGSALAQHILETG